VKENVCKLQLANLLFMALIWRITHNRSKTSTVVGWKGCGSPKFNRDGGAPDSDPSSRIRVLPTRSFGEAQHTPKISPLLYLV